MEPMYVIKTEDAKLHLSKGNSKIGKGIWAFSTLPGNKENLLVLNKTAVLTNVYGTCSKYCGECFKHGCYAVNSAKLHHNVVIKSWAENTLLLRSGKLFEELDKFISKKNARFYKTKKDSDLVVKTFRINVSGEIESVEQFDAWNNLAIAHPEVHFGLYTKNFDDLETFITMRGDTADNFCINVSQWNHVADKFLAAHPGKFNIFEYDETNRKSCTWSEEDRARLEAEKHCPAVTKSGHHAKDALGRDITCDHCGRCYRKTGKVTAVYAH